MKFCSVILVSFNNIHDVEKTLSNLLACEGYLKEIVVVDSSQNTQIRDFIEAVDIDVPIIYLWQHKSGIYSAMNLGASISLGPFIWFCNPGDFPVGKDFFNALKLESEIQDVDWFIGQARIGNNNSWFPTDDKFQAREILTGQIPVSHQSVLCSLRAFQSLGGFNLKYKISADLEFIYKLLFNFNGKPILIPFVEIESGGLSYKKSKVTIFETFLIRLSSSRIRFNL